MSPKVIPFNFVGTGRVGKRLFRGEATLTEDNGRYIVSGSALKGAGGTFLALYWVCGWTTFLGGFVLLEWIASKLGYYPTSATLENFLKNPGKLILDLLVTGLFLAGGVFAAMLLCRFVFREKITVDLPADDISGLIRGKAFTVPQSENQPPAQKRYVTIKMKSSKRGISITCRAEYVSPLSSLLGVPLEEE